MNQSRNERVVALENELKKLKDEDIAERHESHVAGIERLTNGMSYAEMCELREVLNARITKQYVYDSDE